jgi:hypothetical protein
MRAMSDDDKKASDGTADETNSLKHIGGSQSESSPHTRCANALADGIASQVALGAPLQYQRNVADWKSENLNENTACDAVTVGNPKLPMAWLRAGYVKDGVIPEGAKMKTA